MVLPTLSQSISIGGEVKTVIDGTDTLIVMNLKDARPILMDLLDYEIVDSLLMIYMEKDSINGDIIRLQKSKIDKLQETSDNKEQQKINLQKIIDNKNEEIKLKDEEIKKQKTFKVIGMITTALAIILGLII